MKPTLLLGILSLCLHFNLSARIRNGYDDHLRNKLLSLENIQLILRENQALSRVDRKAINLKIKELTNYLSYHSLTDSIINQLQIIAPEIYDEIDQIRDKRGRSIDVFVRLVPRDQFHLNLSAASFFHRSSIDDDVSSSRHGEYSVAVDVCISSTVLIQMCHELGHIAYIVPNLATYRDFYAFMYRSSATTSTLLGHHNSDISGRWALTFERRFIKSNRSYIHTVGSKPVGVYTMLKQIRDSVSGGDITNDHFAYLGDW